MKKNIIFSLMLCFLLISCTSPNEKPFETNESSIYEMAEVQNIKILSNSCNVKSGAGDDFNVVGNLKQNDVVNVLDQVGDWYVVQLDNNKVGCVNQANCQPVVKDGPQTAQKPQPNVQQPQPDQTQPNQPQPQQTRQDNTGTTTQPVKRLTSQEQRMLELVNSERTKNGLSALKVDLEVTRVARIKSQDMVDNNYFSHYSPTYGSPFDMMKSFGINYLHAGENIAANSSVEKAHTALMNSSGHRKNILSPDFTHIGIGIKTSDKYGLMFTQMFISKPK